MTPKFGFKKGNTPWNKGKVVDRDKYPKMGAFGKRSKKQRETISRGHFGQRAWNKGEKRPEFRGENNPAWKGDKVGYRALHHWVNRRLGKPMCCDSCGCTSLKRYHWANKSGKYKREITDWIRLCPKCHGQYDKERRSK